MKTPQRRFVVEFKSGRRQPKAQTKSIWGNTDLKALAREVEETTPHLFNPSEAAGTLNSAETAPADPIDAEPVNQPAHDVDAALAPMPFANGAEVEISKHHEADHPPGTVVQVEESQPASQPRTTSTGTPRKRAKRAYAQPIAHNSEVGNDDPKPQTATVDERISLDELAALEADNKRLKRLLAKQLHAQNMQLKKMLARFDVE
ncbi:hypothetical protein GOB07_24630 [Sinorhizobium meliloti]|uniref:hypothetical protein n=1 Tax=Rhizobium meliloti TaxID=382 RepID=UPI000FD9A58D|nr:hypothetical protein [Sinorhizobium meliloti]MDW9428596.1 hypothetical protein [Sinorhizobium meliloti]MDW9539214.1 hypothetical protein [Sinorhizobium meliloti]MDX0016862.1 hypothetical protein [Sinorhizobium meliloti]MDX0020714.1 hypothetical protein [Sinorhizobium meliloti]MDX0287755.1 hypothetical protein [Sinorhizobium meliloti]